MERTGCRRGMADGTWGVRMFPKGRRLGVKDAPQASHFRECRAVVDGLMGEFYFFLPPISIRPVPGTRLGTWVISGTKQTLVPSGVSIPAEP